MHQDTRPAFKIILFTCAVIATRISAQTPQINLGISSSTKADQDLFASTAGVEAGLDYRKAISDWGRLLFQGTGKLGRFLSSTSITDNEAAVARFGARSGSFDLEVEGSWKSSVAGSIESTAFYNPGWRATVEARPFSLGYSGESMTDLDGADDFLAHGVRFGLFFSPEAVVDLKAGLNVGYELWREQSVYLASGVPGGDKRQDLVISMDQSLSVFLDYFSTLGLEATQGYRASTANRVLAGPLVESGSENGWSAALAVSYSISPTRQLSMEFKTGADGMLYDKRAASGGGTAWKLSPWSGLFADYTPDGRFFFSISINGKGTLSNETAFRTWQLIASATMSYAF